MSSLAARSLEPLSTLPGGEQKQYPGPAERRDTLPDSSRFGLSQLPSGFRQLLSALVGEGFPLNSTTKDVTFFPHEHMGWIPYVPPYSRFI